MKRTWNETWGMVFDLSSAGKTLIRVFGLGLTGFILWKWQGIESVQAEMPIIGSGILAAILLGICVFIINLIFIVPYKITSYHYDKSKKLKHENNSLHNRLRPCLEVTDIYFEKLLLGSESSPQGLIYKLLIKVVNPINRGLTIYKAKTSILSGEQEWGDLRGCKLRFEYDIPNYPYEADFAPGDENSLKIGSFCRSNNKPLELLIGIVNSGEQKTNMRNTIMEEELMMTFRLTCENQQAQEWEVLFGLKNNLFWARATQKFPAPTEGMEKYFEATMPLDPGTPHALTQGAS